MTRDKGLELFVFSFLFFFLIFTVKATEFLKLTTCRGMGGQGPDGWTRPSVQDLMAILEKLFLVSLLLYTRPTVMSGPNDKTLDWIHILGHCFFSFLLKPDIFTLIHCMPGHPNVANWAFQGFDILI